MSETKKKTVAKKPAVKKDDNFKKLALVLADVELPRNSKRLYIEVTPAWIDAAKEVIKSK